MKQVKIWVEKNLALSLLLGILAGFLFPDFGEVANDLVVFLTGLLIFFSCTNIKIKDMFLIDIFQIALFSLLRFMVFPIILFYAAWILFPEYSHGVLLLAIMPAGVAVTALCAMSGGNATLGLGLTVITSLLAPAVVPSVFSFLGQSVDVDTWGLFKTLCLVVFVPLVIYFVAARPVVPVRKWLVSNNKFLSIVVLTVIMLIVVASQKEAFLSEFSRLYIDLSIMVGLFGILYLFGIAFSFFLIAEPKDRISYIFASGAMNNALAVGLSFLYFDSHTTFFVVASEFVWSFCVVAGQWWFSKKQTLG